MYRSIATQFGVSKAALCRHRNAHIPRVLARAQADRESAHGQGLLDQLHAHLQCGKDIIDDALRAGDPRTALVGLREVRGTFELIGKVTGELRAAQHTHMHAHVRLDPEVVGELRDNLAALQAQFPARLARGDIRNSVHVHRGVDAIPKAIDVQAVQGRDEERRH